MLSLQMVREHPDLVREAMRRRGDEGPLDDLLALDHQRRALLQEVETLRARRRTASREIGRAPGDRSPVMVAEMRGIADRIRELDRDLADVEVRVDEALLNIPNLLHASVPDGRTEAENQVVRTWGEPRPFSFAAQPHWDLGTALGILDFERGAKLSGSRFSLLRADGARLERALAAWMLDLHTQRGYVELATPYLVRREAMVGTGQLPKFADDMYRCEADDLYLIPTAEVPVTNLHRDEILDAKDLPLRYVCHSACFRREAGAAGRDTRGLIRVHQFNKVELVKLVDPASSDEELESLVADVEAVLQGLDLPYRVSLMCAGETGVAAAKKYDPEVWMPGQGRYVEISSCSNFQDFQARRARLRYRPASGGHAEFVHTLNGSALAVGRTLAAVLETYQQADGSVVIPPALRSYLGNREVLEPPR